VLYDVLILGNIQLVLKDCPNKILDKVSLLFIAAVLKDDLLGDLF
jgi:hypothetical protein